MLLERCGLGLSRFASIGNQADVRLPELVEHLAGHEPTRAIAIYAEDVSDGRAFVEAARAAARQKPVILLNSGRSAAGARGAASHTGALVTSDAVIAAACREAGIVRVDSPGELVDACQAFVRSPRARGRRVAVIADGGGHGSVAADLDLAPAASRYRPSPTRSWRASRPSWSAPAASATRSTSSTAPTASPRSPASRARAWSRARSTPCWSPATTAATRSTATTTASPSRARRSRSRRCSRARPPDRRALDLRRGGRGRHRPARPRPGLLRARRAGGARAAPRWPRPPPLPAVATPAAPPSRCSALPATSRRAALLLEAGIAYGDGGAGARRRRGGRARRPARALPGHAQGDRRAARAQVGLRRRVRRPRRRRRPARRRARHERAPVAGACSSSSAPPTCATASSS